MPTPKELKSELDGKIIDVRTNSFAMWHTKRYKVLGYDSETDLYSCAPTKVEGPLEHIKLKAENITVYVDVIPVEESSEDETSKSEDEDEDVEELVEKVKKMKKMALRAACTKHELWSSELVQARATVPEMKAALMKKFGLEGSTVSDYQLGVEATSKATAAFFQLASVVAIISTISNFNPKNTAHAQSIPIDAIVFYRKNCANLKPVMHVHHPTLSEGTGARVTF